MLSDSGCQCASLCRCPREHPLQKPVARPVQDKVRLDLHDLHLRRRAQGHPLGLRGAPLGLVELLAGAVGEERRGSLSPCVGTLGWRRARHLLDVPDEGLAILGAAEQMVPRVGRPDRAVHARLVLRQRRQGYRGSSDVDDRHAHIVHGDGGYVVAVDLVPGDSEQRRDGVGLVDDRGVLEVPLVEEPHGAVGPARGEEELLREVEVVDGLVMRDELRLDLLLLYVPDRAGRVHRGRADARGVVRVPVEGREGRVVAQAVLPQVGLGTSRLLLPRVRELRVQLHLPVLLQSEEVERDARRRQHVEPALRPPAAGPPHELRGGEGVLHLRHGHEALGLLIQLYDLDAVGLVLQAATYGQPASRLGPRRPCQGVGRPRSLVDIAPEGGGSLSVHALGPTAGPAKPCGGHAPPI